MTKIIDLPSGLELPTRLGPVVDASVRMPVTERIEAFVQQSGYLRAPETPSPLTDCEIKILSGNTDAEYSTSYLIDSDTALADLDNSQYIQNKETGEWGYWSERGLRSMSSRLVVRELMPLIEIAEHRIPRLLGCLLGSQYFALGLTVEAVPDRDPGFLHYWTLVGTDAETGVQRIELLNRDTYETYLGEPYPVPEKSAQTEQE